jgi:aminoglycoside phosphotransferase (APT) family kinase protein
VESQVTRAEKQLQQFKKHRVLSMDTLAQIKAMLNANIVPLAHKLHPVLLHGDTSESNTIVTKNKKIFYIDWDNAQAGIWLSDFIELSRRQKLESSWKDDPKRQARARKNFFKGYGKINLTTQEVGRVERTLETLRQLWQMHYYYFDKKE